ncbi:MAG: STAS/SEC14 domain-containing protein, partial [Gammaproteobacteria bacterium]
MSLAIRELAPATLELEAAGMLDKRDYARFVPVAERNIDAHGRINLLIDITDCHGWSPPALWEDLKFDR